MSADPCVYDMSSVANVFIINRFALSSSSVTVSIHSTGKAQKTNQSSSADLHSLLRARAVHEHGTVHS